ncbi:MAG: DinB family protein [Planctomycetota bacterium]
MRTNDRRPEPNELGGETYRTLVGDVDGEQAITVLSSQLYWMCELASCISAILIDENQKPHPWTIRQVFSHCIDAERGFGDRIWRTAAGDPGPLVKFDTEAFVKSRYGLGTVTQLITELGALRKANITLLERLTPVAWNRMATFDDQAISVRGWAWITAGHLQRQFEAIESRCGIRVDRMAP